MWSAVLTFLFLQNVDCRKLEQRRAGPKIVNIESALKGYDVILGNVLTAGTGDPGIKTQIFEHWNATADDYNNFIDTRDDKNCEISSQHTTIRTMMEHQQKKTGLTENSFSIGQAFSLNGAIPLEGFILNFNAKASATYSHGKTTEFSEEERFFQETNGEIFQSQAKCQLFVAEIREFDKPVFTDGFIVAVHHLDEAAKNPNSSDSKAVMKLFWNQFGTHYMSRANLGATMVAQSRWASNAITEEARSERSQCVEDAFQSEMSGGVSADVPEVGEWGADSTRNFNINSKRCKGDSFNSNYFSDSKFEQTKVVSKGANPNRDAYTWAENVKDHPVVIGFKLRPISDLFTSSKLAGLNVDPVALKKFFDDSLLNYCEIVLGGPCPPVKGCNVAHTCGDNQLCVNDSSKPEGYTCKNNEINVPTDKCRWIDAKNWGDWARCNGNEVTVASCSGGGFFANKDCEGNSIHRLKCCDLQNYAYFSCAQEKSGYGHRINCRDAGMNTILEGQCHSGSDADCSNEFNRANCCHAKIGNQLVGPDYSQCSWKGGDHGQNLFCPADQVLVGRCGSGGHRDCRDNSHEIYCCKLKYV